MTRARWGGVGPTRRIAWLMTRSPARKLNAAERWITRTLAARHVCGRDGIRPYALYLQARIAAQRDDWRGVLTSLDDLQVGHPDSPLITASRVWSVEALYRLGDYDNVQYRLDTLAARRRSVKTRLAATAGFAQRAGTCGELVNGRPPWNRFDRWPKRKTTTQRWAEANLLVARCELHSHQFEQARGVRCRSLRQTGKN